MNDDIKDWWSKTTSNFVASFLASLFSGMLLLYFGAFLAHKGTSPDVVEKAPESIRPALKAIHNVSADILWVKSDDEDESKSWNLSINRESADKWASSDIGRDQTKVAGFDTHYPESNLIAIPQDEPEQKEVA